MIDHAPMILHSAAADVRAPARRPPELLEARRQRDALTSLLRTEQAAMADFLVALADFDRRRGWEALGHASLFAFLRVELRLSSSAAFYRKSAARLMQRFPELIGPLGDGRLCLSSVAELAKVLTEANRSELVPRFFGLSAREARELVAEILPCEVPVTRTLVTSAVGPGASAPPVRAAPPLLTLASGTVAPTGPAVPPGPALAPGTMAPPGDLLAPLLDLDHPEVAAPSAGANHIPHSTYLTSDTCFGGGARLAAKGDDVEPLTADLRRLHVTVSRQFLKDLEAARDGLSHAIPGASTSSLNPRSTSSAEWPPRTPQLASGGSWRTTSTCSGIVQDLVPVLFGDPEGLDQRRVDAVEDGAPLGDRPASRDVDVDDGHAPILHGLETTRQRKDTEDGGRWSW